MEKKRNTFWGFLLTKLIKIYIYDKWITQDKE